MAGVEAPVVVGEPTARSNGDADADAWLVEAFSGLSIQRRPDLNRALRALAREAISNGWTPAAAAAQFEKVTGDQPGAIVNALKKFAPLPADRYAPKPRANPCRCGRGWTEPQCDGATIRSLHIGRAGTCDHSLRRLAREGDTLIGGLALWADDPLELSIASLTDLVLTPALPRLAEQHGIDLAALEAEAHEQLDPDAERVVLDDTNAVTDLMPNFGDING